MQENVKLKKRQKAEKTLSANMLFQKRIFQKSRIVTLMVRQAHHDNVILSLSKDVEG
jgi:hypothetical protein